MLIMQPPLEDNCPLPLWAVAIAIFAGSAVILYVAIF